MLFFNEKKTKCIECKRVPIILKGKKRNRCPVCHVKTFIETLCCHTKGEWHGKRFELLKWQKERVIEPFFGTLNENGYRQYRTCYLEIPKKNGKTELGAALALYMLVGDDEDGAEVYSAAADREQASLVYNVAAEMVRKHRTLNKRLKVIDSRKRIIDYKTNSFYQVLSAEAYTKHGINPSAIIFDELHAQPNDELWRVLTSGTDYARAQQLVFVMTTAGVYNKESIWWRQREKAQAIESGTVADNSFLPVLYIGDKEKDNPGDEKLWKDLNPSIGHIFTIERVRRDYESAKYDPIEYADFLRYRLNIPISDVKSFIPLEKWEKCGIEPISLDKLKGRECYGGLDLASTLDVTALVLVFPPEKDNGKYIILPYFWLPEVGMEERIRKDGVNYDIWVNQGYIETTPGEVLDYAYVINTIDTVAQTYDVKEIAFDRWGASKIIQDLQAMGFEDESKQHAARHLISFGQGYKSMSHPTKELKNLVFKGQISHGGNPVLRWMINNVVVTFDPTMAVKPDKSKSKEKIDGVVATIMALDRALKHEGPKKSKYDGPNPKELPYIQWR